MLIIAPSAKDIGSSSDDDDLEIGHEGIVNNLQKSKVTYKLADESDEVVVKKLSRSLLKKNEFFTTQRKMDAMQGKTLQLQREYANI